MSSMLRSDRGALVLQRLERHLAPVRLGWIVAFARAPGRGLEFAGYIGVSALALTFDMLVFLALLHLAGVNAPLAGALGYISGTALHYMLAVRFIFVADATGKSHRRLMTEYAATALFGVALTTTLMIAATSLGSAPVWAKAAAVAVTFVTVYLLRSAGVFAPKAA